MSSHGVAVSYARNYQRVAEIRLEVPTHIEQLYLTDHLMDVTRSMNPPFHGLQPPVLGVAGEIAGVPALQALMAASASVLMVAIRALPQYVRARSVVVKAKLEHGGRTVDLDITAANADEAVRMIEQALSGQTMSMAPQTPPEDASTTTVESTAEVEVPATEAGPGTFLSDVDGYSPEFKHEAVKTRLENPGQSTVSIARDLGVNARALEFWVWEHKARKREKRRQRPRKER